MPEGDGTGSGAARQAASQAQENPIYTMLAVALLAFIAGFGLTAGYKLAEHIF